MMGLAHHSGCSISIEVRNLVVARYDIFRPKIHLLIQAVHRRVDDLELEMLHAVLDEFVDTAAHVVYRTEDVTVESKLHAVDIALIALTARLERRHCQVQSLVAGLGNGREFLDGDGDLRGITTVVTRRL